MHASLQPVLRVRLLFLRGAVLGSDAELLDERPRTFCIVRGYRATGFALV